ncbi:hypothetical protein F1C58_16595 (plasmid) [Glaciihabitans sp. INWT7]|uniref:type II secretion system F family protein n=1 Tax=Glaciihabitans sp. INWT7 TaxID=2596912 RepID=UPI001623B51F|nr:type II secretion system F family protein [Glaciihabitans sp. INWT7]QNE48676.1 hypothetical protein F1C58_16595 [Glaciihabitans sp. INWT7]
MTTPTSNPSSLTEAPTVDAAPVLVHDSIKLTLPSKKALRPARKTKADKEAIANARAAERSKDVSTSDGTGEKKRPAITIVAKKSSVDDLAETLEDLASMLEAGESEDRAVSQLADQYAKVNIGQAYRRASVRMREEGDTIIAALCAETDVFPQVARELISAGTTPRDLHANLRQAASIIVASSDVKAKVRSALFKPLLTLGIVLAFILVAAEWLLPGVVTMFTSIGAKAPAMTVVMIAVGGSLKWAMGAAAVLWIAWLVYWGFIGRKNKQLRVLRDRLALRAPLVGPITQMGAAGRFCDVLAACLSSGMTELDALEIAGRSCGNEAIEAHVREHILKQRVGEAVFGDVARTPLFPWNLSHRIDIAPSPRERIKVMRDLAQTFNKKSERRLAEFVDKVGPITEIVVLTAAAVVILMVAIPVTTFAPALLHMAG